ncbi:hypothetical protein QP027_06545 [Corynebacterium breve]|uniref:Uncharacterized protein n=1 Tax=Corynebacterium breve TaxID=3049799 RepID=A0ABY8VBJ6_9CORY|nr:hypothetical protein [Corynebacterium breve]WIM66794.1 hypothetical protein QP027_06545 [Corynebacterium breve]
MSTTPHSTSADEAAKLADKEREIAGKIDFGGYRWAILAAIVLFVFSLIIPFAGGVNGFEVLLNTQSAKDAGVKLPEMLFAWIGLIGLVIVGSIGIGLRNSTAFIISWSLTTIALIESLLALWLRQTDQGYGTAFGIYLAILAVIVAEICYIIVGTSRNPEQEAIARERQKVDNIDEIGEVQLSATENAADKFSGPNPLLIDDRRARAAERHRRPDNS